MPEQAIQHARQPAEQTGATVSVLSVVGDQAEQHGQTEQVDTALACFDTPSQFPVPHAVHGQVQDAEVDQHRRNQPPPLPRCQTVGQRRELDVLAQDAERQKRQPGDGLQVVPQQGQCADDNARQQHRRRNRAVTHLLGKTRTRHRRLFRDIQLLVGVPGGKPLVQHAHVVADGLGHPQHLLARLFADAMGHLHALQQFDEAAQIDTQGQAQYSHGTHVMTSGRSTSTHTNLRGSRRVS